ncbi:hypothetical protein [Leifsonia xyli]|uniref:hypothetical protein n=1 Tax=Leifsonia xyli TaxID=1575 RepID=UPI000A5CE36A
MSGPARRDGGRRGNQEFQVFAARLTVFFAVIAAGLGVLLAFTDPKGPFVGLAIAAVFVVVAAGAAVRLLVLRRDP